MRIVFMGTPDYACSALKALVDARHEVAAVFTQPDRPRGRGGKTQAPPAKVLAQQLGIPVYQPRRIREDGMDDLRRLAPDLCVTAAFGQILSPEALSIPPLGTVNVHASLLPRYRGSAPVNWCIIAGEQRTGVTTMMTDQGIDTGDILLQEALDILPYETAGELTPRLAALGAQLLVQTLAAIQRGDCPRTRQQEELMSYHPMLTRDMGEVDWSQPADRIVNLIHGLNPWPCASSQSPHGRLKLLTARPEEGQGAAPGSLLSADGKQGMLVQAGDGAVRLLTIQAPGGRQMAAQDYLRGHPMAAGSRLGGQDSEGMQP